jgi:hypothetical protein
MSELFGRTCAVFLDGLEVIGLRTQFKVEKGDGKEPNKCEVNVTNLAESTRSQMAKKHAKLVLQAGYDTTIATIFSGDTRSIDHVKSGADWVTKAQAGDGERAYLFARANESFRAGTRVGDVILHLTRALGINPGNALEKASRLPSALQVYRNGYVVNGKASAELDKVLHAAGLRWSIQDGALQILGDGESNKQQVIFLSPDSGLIDSPAHSAPDKKKPGASTRLKVKAFLQPTLRPGGRVAIDSRGTKGQFRIHKVTHTGDTSGGDWYTELECSPA